jgi:hypothetical protein
MKASKGTANRRIFEGSSEAANFFRFFFENLFSSEKIELTFAPLLKRH